MAIALPIPLLAPVTSALPPTSMFRSFAHVVTENLDSTMDSVVTLSHCGRPDRPARVTVHTPTNRLLRSPRNRPAGNFRPHKTSATSWACPTTGSPDPNDHAMSSARRAISPRSAPKYLAVLGF